MQLHNSAQQKATVNDSDTAPNLFVVLVTAVPLRIRMENLGTSRRGLQ
jgi:hypothetical protein